jgi:hypothetical protein
MPAEDGSTAAREFMTLIATKAKSACVGSHALHQSETPGACRGY